MNVLLLAAGALVVAGGIACVTARHGAIVALGAALLLGLSPLLVEPLPAPLLIAERVVGAGLAAELLWLTLRGRVVAGSSPVGWPALAFLAGAAFVAGLAMEGFGAPDIGVAVPPAALGTTLALVTVAVIAAIGRPDGVQLALCALLLVAAASVAMLALSGPASSLETLLVAGVGLAVAASTAVLVPAAPAPPPLPSPEPR